MTTEQKKWLHKHLQWAMEVELSTIPLYLYTYYSIMRVPENTDGFKDGQALATFTNEAGGLIMSVAVEEMLHLSLAGNLLRALGGKPQLYNLKQAKPAYPTNVPHHKSGFSIGLTKLTKDQLYKFMQIELPETPTAPPEEDNFETIGQFYDAIENYIATYTTDADFSDADHQLGAEGYYADSNIDTTYPKDAYYRKQKPNPKKPSQLGASEAVYANQDDSGSLSAITTQAAALQAIRVIKHQGEGFKRSTDHEFDDDSKFEQTHYFKFQSLYNRIGNFDPSELNTVLFQFPDNPTRDNCPKYMLPLVDLANAVYAYLLWITEISFSLSGAAQKSMFYIGMHKGMIFILDKIIGGMRYLNVSKGVALAPTFENYKFKSIETAKAELVALCEKVAADPSLKLDSNILQRIKDLPDVNVVNGKVSFA